MRTVLENFADVNLLKRKYYYSSDRNNTLNCCLYFMIEL